MQHLQGIGRITEISKFCCHRMSVTCEGDSEQELPAVIWILPRFFFLKTDGTSHVTHWFVVFIRKRELNSLLIHATETRMNID